MNDYTNSGSDSMLAEELKEQIADLRSQLKYNEARLDFSDEGEVSEQIDQSDIREKIEMLRAEIEIKESKLREFKTFKKERFIQNIRDLLKKTPNIKISQIESEANCSPGYLSRLAKEGNTTDPCIEFVATAARLLGVSIDFLLMGTVEDLSQTESFLVDFINSVIEDTANDKMIWQTVEEPRKEYVSVTGYPEDLHPLFSGSNDFGGHFVVCYNSVFESNVHLAAGFNSYTATLPNSKDRLYVMLCTLMDDDAAGQGSTFVECYLKTNDDLCPLCTSHNAREAIHNKLMDLYKEISESAKRIHISRRAVDSIKWYMKKRIPEEPPF